MRKFSRKQVAGFGLGVCLLLWLAVAFLGEYPPCWAEYPNWQTSPYVLPYPPGESYPLYQGNCTFSLKGHHGVYQYSYDFLLPIGATVTAARDGVVIETLDGFTDGNNGSENWVKVQHADGTIAAYSHLHSLLVKIGDHIHTGDSLGLSGNTGQTGGVPHLHFHVSRCSEPVECGTIPVTFRNTIPNPHGLLVNQVYEAYP